MKSRGYVTLEEYEQVLGELRRLQDENNELKHMMLQQESLISELRGSASHLQTRQSSSCWFRPPISPPCSTYGKSRSGSAQSRRSFHSIRMSTNLNSLEAIEEEILKAEDLREKSYEDLMTSHFSPSKAARLKSIVERWDLEIESLRKKREEMLRY